MKNKSIILILVGLGLIFASILTSAPTRGEKTIETISIEDLEKLEENYDVATLAGGCFWCLESEIAPLEGVAHTVVGYTGGHLKNPTYKDITTGNTGHAEAVQIYYDPEITNFENLLDYFFTSAHDPTQLNKQWVDVGTQYRSTVFYHSEKQKNATKNKINELNQSGSFDKPIVTTLEPAQRFWTAEEYHQKYYDKYEQEKGRKHIRVILKEKRKAAEKK